MRVIRADAMGMCFGVKDAIEAATLHPRPQNVTIHGQLVHNPVVNQRLNERGFHQAEETARAVPTLSTPEVLITAHGVSDTERARLLALGAQLIDTTCPLVKRAHRAAAALKRQGYFVVVLGKPAHVEVEGLTGDLDAFAVVHCENDVRDFQHPRIGIICQTTTPPALADQLSRAVAKRNPNALEIRFVDTVCRPTKERQIALDRLLDQVEAVVVVGGRNSNNTRALLARCIDKGKRAWQVEHAGELDPAWFEGIDKVGLTAGTSTLDETIDDVQARLIAIGKPQRTIPLCEPALALA
jgi:4-hydroxy-3-methylbut-2-enyl diphosphate reductase